MYPVYDTPHKLCNIRGNKIIQQPRLPPNNAGNVAEVILCMCPAMKDGMGLLPDT